MVRERKKEISCKKSNEEFLKKKKGRKQRSVFNRKEDKKRENLTSEKSSLKFNRRNLNCPLP